jgi:hypothetical protein
MVDAPSRHRPLTSILSSLFLVIARLSASPQNNTEMAVRVLMHSRIFSIELGHMQLHLAGSRTSSQRLLLERLARSRGTLSARVLSVVAVPPGSANWSIDRLKSAFAAAVSRHLRLIELDCLSRMRSSSQRIATLLSSEASMSLAAECCWVRRVLEATAVEQ